MTAQCVRDCREPPHGVRAGMPGIEVAAQIGRTESRELLGTCQRSPGLLPFETHGHVRHAARLRAHGDCNLRPTVSNRRCRSGPLETQLHGLFDRLSGAQREGVRKIQRPHVRLVRRIGPVALVLHLESVPQHRAGHPESRRDLMAERTDVHDRLLGVNHFRKAGLDHLATHLGHQRWMPADSLQAMQDDETGPVRDEIRLRSPVSFKAKRAVRAAGDARSVDVALPLVRANRRVRDGEAIAGLFHAQVADFRVVGAPVLVPHDVGNGADRFVALVPDVPKIAGIQLGGKRPRRQRPGPRRGFPGPEQHDRAGRNFGHGRSPRPVPSVHGAAPGVHSSLFQLTSESRSRTPFYSRPQFPPVSQFPVDKPAYSANCSGPFRGQSVIVNGDSIPLRTRSRRRPAGAPDRSASPRLLQQGPAASYHLPCPPRRLAPQPADHSCEWLTERPGPPSPDARQFVRRIRSHQHSENPITLFMALDR